MAYFLKLNFIIMDKKLTSFEIWIFLNNNWEVIWTITDTTQSNVHMILELPEDEYNEVVHWKTHSRIIFENLSKNYKLEIDKFLNYKLNEAA